MDATLIMEAIDDVAENYEHKRVEELLSTAKGGSRISQAEVPTILAKAQAAREIRNLLFTRFGFDA
jgi:hypothetical protein